MYKILLLEDNEDLTEGLKYLLEKKGYDVDTAKNLTEGKSKEIVKYDLLILDISLPDGTGYEMCEYIRKKEISTPIIFLTAADEETDIIRGLDMGGDDYITKPFKTGELVSRINALLRRSSISERKNIKSGHIIIDNENFCIYKDGNKLELTVSEYKILCLLVKNTDKIVTRNIILDILWDGNFVDDNTLSVYIRRLREKIEDDPSKPKHLITVRGFGYKWQEDIK